MSSLSAVPPHFFFYGTLVAGNPNRVAARIHTQLQLLGPGCTMGDLHAIPDAAGWFPALVPREGEGVVQGQLCRALPGFDPALLARMDAYEDFDPANPSGSLYRRQSLTVRVEDGADIVAEAYVWNRSLPQGAEPIAGGHFGDWIAATGRVVFSATRGD